MDPARKGVKQVKVLAARGIAVTLSRVRGKHDITNQPRRVLGAITYDATS